MAMNPVINSLKEEEKINQSASYLRSLHYSWCAERHSGLAVESLTFACRVSGTRKSCSSKELRGGDCAETAMDWLLWPGPYPIIHSGSGWLAGAGMSFCP